MTKKKIILIAGVIALCVLVGLAAVLFSSGSDEPEVQPIGTTGTEDLTYTVVLKDEAGSAVSQVGVYIYADYTLNELVWFDKTDDNGRMTFTDLASDNYVAVLEGVPAGFLVEEYYRLTGENTEIVLESGLMEGDLNSVTYELGDLMLDFTVTAADGSEYTLSELLKEYKAVVLNFWYLQCEPCKSEFPYLQEAYETYSEDVAVLAMNPVNEDNDEIAQFQKDNGYTFPMMAVDPAWEKAMQLTAYPTTVVIDRYGKICLIHTGSIPDAETFETMFSFYSAEEYEQTVSEDLEDLEEAAGVEQTVGTKDNPVEIGGLTTFQVTVEPGQLMYYNIYKLTGVRYLSIRNENAYVVYNGKTYYPNNGTVSLAISSDDVSTACQVVFGNSGDETQTYTVTMGSAAGSQGNPYTLTLGDFTTNVAAGNNTGVWYTYVPKVTGLFTIEVKSATAGVNYGISVNTYTANGIGTVQRTLESEGTTNSDGNKTVSINAYAGKAIQITVATLPDSNNVYPAATFRLNATLEEGKSLATTYVETVTYSVNVTDELGVGIAGVNVIVANASDNNNQISLVTNEKGVAYTSLVPYKKLADGTEQVYSYPVTVVVPNGYRASTTELTLTQNRPSASIKLDTIAKVKYRVRVVDKDEKPVAGAQVFFTDPETNTVVSPSSDNLTDSNGWIEYSIAEGTYTVSVVKDGYICDPIKLNAEKKEGIIELVEGTDAVEYTVKAVDYFGNPISGMKLTFSRNGGIVGTADVINGEAKKQLPSGVYTVGVLGNYYTPGITLTETQTIATATIICGVSGDTTTVNGKNVPCLNMGATYVQTAAYNLVNYYTFTPARSGRYQFTFLDNQLIASSTMQESYQGSNPQYPMDGTVGLNDEKMQQLGNYYIDEENTFVVNIREQNLGATYIVGIKQANDAVIVIEYAGEAITDETDIVPSPYTATCSIDENFSLPAGTKLTYINPLTQTAADVSYHKGSDGYYHLNSPNGPILYVNLGPDAPYLSMSDAMAVTDDDAVYLLIDVVRDEDGNPVKRIRYNECMTAYVNVRCGNTGVYPLNDDLILMFTRASELKGWANYADSKSDYLFIDQTTGERIKGADPDITWMYAVCYINP